MALFFTLQHNQCDRALGSCLIDWQCRTIYSVFSIKTQNEAADNPVPPATSSLY
ncbi:MAG: hypothetical protein V7K98_04105 [Nostoc sp.]|uniref:hypothetical protein n=1 Tax=Nostoc sp. TaxID=1180 RepID=UPI002FF52E74